MAYGLTVLVVQGEASLRRLMVRALRDNRYRVLEARDGHEAFRRCREAGGSLDLVVTDVITAGIAGAELVARAREDHPSLAAVYVSGYRDEVISRLGGAASGGELLEKPFSREALLLAAGNALGVEPAGAVPAEARPLSAPAV